MGGARLLAVPKSLPRFAALAAEGYRENSRFLDSADHSQANDPAPLGMTNRNDKIET
jgi:hypothetical protein